MSDGIYTFDDRLFMGPPPPRRLDVLCWGSSPATVRMVNALRKLNVSVDAIDVAAPREIAQAFMSYAVVFLPHDEYRHALTALAAGAALVADGRLPQPDLHPAAHYILMPDSRTTGSLDLTCAVIEGIYRRRPQATGFAEDVRRDVFTRLSRAARQAVQADVRHRIDSLTGRVPAVGDAYMWPPERALLWLAARDLPPGDVLELGVGNGGTFAVLATASERTTYGIDDFSYGGALQRAHVNAAALECPNMRIIEGRTSSVAFNSSLALLHVDAGHDHDECAADLNKFATMIVPGGILAVDDYGTYMDQPGVRGATDEFIARAPSLWAPHALGPKLALWRRVAA